MLSNKSFHTEKKYLLKIKNTITPTLISMPHKNCLIVIHSYLTSSIQEVNMGGGAVFIGPKLN